jgi:hypothetical protein
METMMNEHSDKLAEMEKLQTQKKAEMETLINEHSEKCQHLKSDHSTEIKSI